MKFYWEIWICLEKKIIECFDSFDVGLHYKLSSKKKYKFPFIIFYISKHNNLSKLYFTILLIDLYKQKWIDWYSI